MHSTTHMASSSYRAEFYTNAIFELLYTRILHRMAHTVELHTAPTAQNTLQAVLLCMPTLLPARTIISDDCAKPQIMFPDNVLDRSVPYNFHGINKS